MRKLASQLQTQGLLLLETTTSPEVTNLNLLHLVEDRERPPCRRQLELEKQMEMDWKCRWLDRRDGAIWERVREVERWGNDDWGLVAWWDHN